MSLSEEEKRERNRQRSLEYSRRPEVIARQKERRKDPKIRARINELARKRNQRPDVKAKISAHNKTLKRKQQVKKNRQKPEAKRKAKERREKPEVKAKMRAYTQRPDFKERRRLYYQRPEVRKRNNRKMKERYQKTGGKAIRRLFPTLLNRDGPVCGICKKFLDPRRDVFQIDHIKPISKGGESHIDNLQLAHPTCNRAKSDLWTDSCL